MRAGGSKQKGGIFEREICVKLSLWVSGGKSRDLFWRSAMSGGRATMGQRRGEKLSRQAGDICSVSPEGHALTDKYFIELKHVRNLGFGQFFTENKGPLAKYWDIACEEAGKYGKRAMLIAKQNRAPIILITEAITKARYVGPITPMSVCWGIGAEVYLLEDVLARKFQAFK